MSLLWKVLAKLGSLPNLDGTQFLSIHFAGPIRAAGGTAQALAVLIGDTIRRELDVDAYKPSDDEVERVKEEFGLYRGNLQYRPPPKRLIPLSEHVRLWLTESQLKILNAPDTGVLEISMKPYSRWCLVSYRRRFVSESSKNSEAH